MKAMPFPFARHLRFLFIFMLFNVGSVCSADQLAYKNEDILIIINLDSVSSNEKNIILSYGIEITNKSGYSMMLFNDYFENELFLIDNNNQLICLGGCWENSFGYRTSLRLKLIKPQESLRCQIKVLMSKQIHNSEVYNAHNLLVTNRTNVNLLFYFGYLIDKAKDFTKYFKNDTLLDLEKLNESDLIKFDVNFARKYLIYPITF